MNNVYAITDLTAKSDVLVFISDNDGSAKSFFVSYSVTMKRDDFALVKICNIDFLDTEIGGQYMVVNADRAFICDMSEFDFVGDDDE